MSSVNILISLSIIFFKFWPLGVKTLDNEMTDFKRFHNYLSTQDPNLYKSSQVKGDIQLYNAGLKNEDIHLNVSQLIRKYGYDVEEHDVQTEDGYIITLIRIPNKGRVVFLMHGLISSADDWVVAGPDSAIAYSLANEGYDVWMGNARGNKHSRRHEVLSPSSPEFWNFSWDEIGRYDLPAMIDYVLAASKQTKLFYVGHSQGGTAFLVMCSELPEYNDKIALMVAMAAPGAVPNIKSPLLNLIKYITLYNPDILLFLLREIGFNEFLPSNNLKDSIKPTICGETELAKIVCSNIAFLICGFDEKQQNITNLPVIFSHAPSGSATKQVQHYAQTVKSGKFRRFDYGTTKNLEIYGTQEPPEYQVEKITAPTAIFYSDNDWIVSYEDLEVLRTKLQNVIDLYKVPLPAFNHLDYLYAKDLQELVFKRLLFLLKKYY